MTSDGQLSFVEAARVELVYHPDRPPPDATGPTDYGAFEARLARESGWGSSERLALAALAERLRRRARVLPGVSGITPISQALVAADLFDRDRLEQWLAGRAGEPVLHEPGSGG